jgi:hypothetical protein
VVDVEIKELAEKYVIVKRNDIGWLNDGDRQQFWRILDMLRWKRENKGKPLNKYVVLNLDDKINLPYLLENIPEDVECDDLGNIQVKDLSVVLVNAILEAAGTP